jgi:AraC-like DNA-binding protein
MLQELCSRSSRPTSPAAPPASPLWRGSRFEDSRIRRAIGLLRARPNKELNIDELASQVGLSRSRFYDLFQLCTGFSPRAYLDMLWRRDRDLAPVLGQGKIGRVSAELGFSAQSNFTRFFRNQVGVPAVRVPPRRHPARHRRRSPQARSRQPRVVALR